MLADFRISLEQKECPDRPFTEIVPVRVEALRQQGDLMKPTIDRLMKLIGDTIQ